ncbi:RimK/LysX family protein [Candidatus Woesearchaeota archaeon]|nr:RimK/LysX family protein [Candidatus Woesearchaeota archaeon]
MGFRNPKNKTLIGLTESVTFIGSEKKKRIRARIDTGADICSLDQKMAKKLDIGPIEKMKKIKSASGTKRRPIVRGRIEIAGRKFAKVRLTLADRSNLKYKALIGKNILKRGFLIDPSKK